MPAGPVVLNPHKPDLASASELNRLGSCDNYFDTAWPEVGATGSVPRAPHVGALLVLADIFTGSVHA